MEERKKQFGNCAQDDLLSTPAVGRSWKKKQILGPTTHTTQSTDEVTSRWSQRIGS